MRRSLLALLALALLVAAVPAYGATRSVSVVDNAFRPGSLTVKRGDTVRFAWRGEIAHNVVATRGPVKFRSPVKRSGTYRKRLTRAGSYRIVCELHPGMGMTLRVR